MPQYITGTDLAELIKTQTPKKDFAIIDVRDDDFAGGNIVGCINKPSRDFMMEVDGLVKEMRDVKKVVFHCSLSQQRGPKAARVYEETRNNVMEDAPEQEVLILRNGFSAFQQLYKDNPKLVEKWDESYWGEEWS